MTITAAAGDRALPPEVEARLAELGGAELVVGLFSYEHARTIAGVLDGIEKGVRAHFPGVPTIVVHSDGGSTDGTVEAVEDSVGDLPVVRLTHYVPGVQRATPPVAGVPGADAAFRAFCRVAATVGARASLLVGADLRALPDEWIEGLLRPVWEGELDFAAPLFARHALDGTMTTCLLYPLARALYGRAVRHMAPSEVAISADLLGHLAETATRTRAARTLPLFLTTSAAAHRGARLGELWVGPRAAEPHGARSDLGAVMSESVGAEFALAELYEEQWREGAACPEPRRCGQPVAPLTPSPVPNLEEMVTVFRQGVRDLVPIWEHALSPATMADLYPLADLAPDEFTFSPALWARVVYDSLLAYRFRVLHRDHLLRSLVPLYLGRVAGLAREVAGRPAAVQERLVERQVEAFQAAKADFADRWR